MTEQEQNQGTKINSEQIPSEQLPSLPKLESDKSKQVSSLNTELNVKTVIVKTPSTLDSNNSHATHINRLIIPISDKKFKLNGIQEFFPQYKTIYDVSQFLINKILSQKNEKNLENSNKSEFNNFNGRFHIKTPLNHEIQLFFQNFALNNSCELLTMDLIEFFNYPKNNLLSLTEELTQFLTSMEISHPFILIFPLDEFDYILNSDSHNFNSNGNINQNRVNLYHFFQVMQTFNPLSLNGIFLFITSPGLQIPPSFGNFFDIELKLHIPDLKFKKHFIDSILKDKPDKDVDIDHISLQMKGWNVAEIRKFLNYAYKLYLINQNSIQTNRIKFNTEFLIDLLENNQLQVSFSLNNLPKADIYSKNNQKQFKLDNSTIDSSKLSAPLSNSSFEQQLYQDAASKYYEDLSIILDKMQKGMVLLPFERQIIADYSFMLKDDPKRALQKLNKAKFTIDKFIKTISDKNLN